MTVESLSSKLVELASKKKAKIVLAESCTGGAIASSIVSIAGSSDVLESAIVAYSDRSKVELLKVDPVLIKARGSVSEQVAKDMAISALKASSSASIALATTGFAGPTGDKVGLVYIALATEDNLKCEEYTFSGNRDDIRESAVKSALNMLIHHLNT